jgi:hypothetical protein
MRLLDFPERNLLLVVTDEMMLLQIAINAQGKAADEKMRASIFN